MSLRKAKCFALLSGVTFNNKVFVRNQVDSKELN